MTDEQKPIKVTFAPGSFDNFEGTQEELDELIAEIRAMFEGKTHAEIVEMGTVIDMDELFEDDPEMAEVLQNIGTNPNTLQ